MDAFKTERPHGTVARVSRLSGVPHETVRRYYAGGNVGINTVEKIREAEGITDIRDEDKDLETDLAIAREVVESLVQRFAGLDNRTPDEQALLAHLNGAQAKLDRAATLVAGGAE